MSIIGDILGYSSQKKAANKALEAERYQVDTNNALQTKIRNENTANISPFMQRGNMAGANINALLGLGDDPAAAGTAFDRYQGSTGYQFRMGQGADAINQNNVTSGLLKSGKALKDLTAFGQGIGSAEFGNYLAYLDRQQGLGLQGANALAGVNTNYVNGVSANNNQLADATGNAAFAKSNAFTNALGATENRLAQALGFGSSYGR